MADFKSPTRNPTLIPLSMDPPTCSAVAIIDVQELIEIKEVANQIQKISGVERTETMVEVQ